ncbi:hypothetical protein BU24DRAFT_427207 [Aaosphaeria arxii CBS 175.79]|uniref:Uncharacterized protein n=1 Tax=Aaosphaeria arxii CBS 175.79 TaxID=1450172 RepID=A0A6A5XDQ6_9PLEO|nr:uncharacterized protein BU24DRAFT_427207 [Aaosphaeria arxii CBS 175.79]KAF2011003.1 hypothetical protein BU24DRAFT_427207 [Aaosphaeria arxii CBS 175.79]
MVTTVAITEAWWRRLLIETIELATYAYPKYSRLQRPLIRKVLIFRVPSASRSQLTGFFRISSEGPVAYLHKQAAHAARSKDKKEPQYYTKASATVEESFRFHLLRNTSHYKSNRTEGHAVSGSGSRSLEQEVMQRAARAPGTQSQKLYSGLLAQIVAKEMKMGRQ